ncbi:MAG: protein kinase, partial [Myxococcales bacterium]|nr:protein kinase [Myxococcales bacterium]
MAFDEHDPGVTRDAETKDGDPMLSTGAVGPGLRRPGAEVEIGDRLGEYLVERRLGAGGMGEVFAACHLPSGERYALKILGRVSPTTLYRFKREFRALADVDHPNLISLHELVVPSDGVPFFSMELVDGAPFIEYVRGRTPTGQLPNLVRLTRALRQLIGGLHHLHLAQCLHRDVKPSNVMVTREGRVVILDFGLVSELAGDERVTHDGALLGTPAYMAPEQAMAGKAGPAADYYAVGVMLYESLTGELPFRGSSLQVMMHKQEGEIPDPRAKVAEVPDNLRELCMRLMARDPERRPGGRELLVELDEGMAPSSSDGSSTQLVQAGLSLAGASLAASSLVGVGGAPFIGRRRELEALDLALRDVEELRSTVTVHVFGGSGLGKSALLSRFLSRVRRKHDVLVLSGRCLERESVPYKGVDAIIDALSIQLRRLAEVEAGALQPRNIHALTRIFPVLGDVWERGGAAGGALGAGDGGTSAAEQRRLGLAALRELLVRLSDRKPLLICIDDFQWADIDSIRLLINLMRPPDPPTMLVLLGYRDDLEHRREALDELIEPAALIGRDIRELELGPMAPQDALDLATRLLGDEAERGQAQAVVDRAEANPFFIGQMILGRHQDALELGLDEIVARRIVDLDPEVRVVLAAVAIAGGPLSLGILLELLELEPPASLEGTIDELCALGLLQRVRSGSSVGASSASGARSPQLDLEGEQVLDITQGRIREVVISELEPGELQALHLRLAAVLERCEADLETLAEHFARGGDAERAADYAERAAIQAAEALAFARAVELYQRTLTLLPATASGAKRRALRLELARQLINLGHGAAAAEIMLELAVVAKRDEARALHRRAAEQLLRSGRLDEGLDLSRGLLEEVGEPLPGGFWSSVWMFARERARLWLAQRFGSTVPRLRSAEEVPPQLLARLDIISMIATGLSLQDVMLTQALHARGQYLAHRAGEPRRLALMLSFKSGVDAAMGRLDAAHAGL